MEDFCFTWHSIASQENCWVSVTYVYNNYDECLYNFINGIDDLISCKTPKKVDWKKEGF